MTGAGGARVSLRPDLAGFQALAAGSGNTGSPSVSINRFAHAKIATACDRSSIASWGGFGLRRGTRPARREEAAMREVARAIVAGFGVTGVALA